MWWGGVVGVAGTQRRTQANERPHQAAYVVQQEFILQTKPAQKQHTPTDTHSQTYTVSAGRKESKHTVQSNRSSEQTDTQNLCFLGPLQL